MLEEKRRSVWVICPRVLFAGVSYPKVAFLEDIGAPVGQWVTHDPITGIASGIESRHKYFDYSGAIGLVPICLTRVSGLDFTSLSLDPDIKIIMKEGESLNSDKRLWRPERILEYKNALLSAGLTKPEILDSDPPWKSLGMLGAKIMRGFETRGTWTR